jgi:hypothetical protein
MKAVVQEDRTGCAIASVAALTGQSYVSVKRAAAKLGISVNDPTLWSDPQPMRTLLASCGLTAGRKEEPFRSWADLPSRALLAIKWHREKSGPAWHWVVFARNESDSFVLDSKRGLRLNRRTDFGRIKPKWFIRVNEGRIDANAMTRRDAFEQAGE